MLTIEVRRAMLGPLTRMMLTFLRPRVQQRRIVGGQSIHRPSRRGGMHPDQRGVEGLPNLPVISELLGRVKRLRDPDRRRLAEAWRGERDRDPRHLAEMRYAAFQALIESGREGIYVSLLHEVGLAYLPDEAAALALAEDDPDLTTQDEWNEIGTLAHEALDDILLGLVVEDRASGPALRLQRSWRAIGSETPGGTTR